MPIMPIEELLNIELVENTKKPLYLQLYQVLTQQIIKQQIPSGARLPASRKLAQQLAVSRNTVQKAYEQLIAEGYLKAMKGSGVFVNAEIPDNYCQPAKLKKPQAIINTPRPSLGSSGDFTPGISDLDAFPHKTWSRLCQKVLRTQYKSLLFSNDYCGDDEFKQTLVEYLAYARNVRCKSEQVIITSGAQEAINLTMRVLLNANTPIAIENPGYRGAYHAAQASEALIQPIPVLADGIDIDALKQQSKTPKVVYITPSHQYPLGHTLSISKRLALIEYAQQNNCYLIEDDYDSEFHYKTNPLPSMQGLDNAERVIYLGTFSKVLFPAIRLGFLIVPKQLLPQFRTMKRFGFGQTPLFNQAVLNEFIQTGYFARHLKRMRVVYAEKHRVIKAACEKYLPNNVETFINDIGLHIALRLPSKVNDIDLLDRLKQYDLFPIALSKYCYSETKQQGLVIGFANTSVTRIEQGIATIARELR